MLSNDFLCDSCSLLVSSTTQERKDGKHQPSVNALKLSAKNGCPLCVQLWDNYLHWDWKPQDLKLLDGSTTDSGFTYTWAGTRCWFEGYRQPDEYYEGGFETIAVIVFCPIDNSNDVANFNASSHTGSMESLDLTTKWLHTCIETHKCLQIKKDYFPTRVLDLGPVDTPILRLYIKDEFAPQEPYATLSHCWGNVPLKRLLKETLLSMTKGLVFDELPKTFQDAIALTRHLKIKYLWIDSLCIIQDSNEDWEKESEQMEFVYKNAVVNIAATAAANSQEGCFVERDAKIAEACRVKIANFVGDSDETISTDIFDLISHDWEADVPMLHTPLSRRAWVAQEQYLSNRIIHCTRSQLYWECRELFASERYPNGVPSPAEGYELPDLEWYTGQVYTDSSPIKSTNEPDDKDHPEDIEGLEKWNSVIENYSGRLMTREQDKLIAISGLAKDIQPFVHNYQKNSRYLAGLWERFLPEQLLWTAKRFPWVTTDPVRSKSYCAPSWSWASIHGAIEHYGTFGDESPQLYMIRILEATTTPVTSNLMGQVSGGHIRLRGWLKLFSIERNESDKDETVEEWFIAQNEEAVGEVSFDERYPFSVKRQKFFCLPILRDHSDKLPDITAVVGLVLKPLEKENLYERVGMFEVGFEYPWKFFTRPNYPATSETPMEGKASSTDEISELIQGINGKADEAVDSSPGIPTQVSKPSSTKDGDGEESGKESDKDPGKGADAYADYEYDEGWVESIVTII